MRRRLTSYFKTLGAILNLLFMFFLDKDDESCLHYTGVPHRSVKRTARKV